MSKGDPPSRSESQDVANKQEFVEGQRKEIDVKDYAEVQSLGQILKDLKFIMDVAMTRSLFDLNESIKYKDKIIIFPKDAITSVPAICGAIDRMGLADVFKTDAIIRLYDSLSVVSHRGLR
jgi:hypothetical protein